MEILLDEGQALLQASAERFAKLHGGGARMRAVRGAAAGFDRQRLGAAAQAGWLMLLVPGAAGGLGLGCTELALVLEQAGAGLVTEPVAQLAAVAHLLAATPSPASERWLAPLMAGKAIVLPAFARDGAAGDSDTHHTIEARADGSGWHLHCVRRNVPCAGGADAYVIDASTGSGRLLAIVRADAAGVRPTKAATVDGSHRVDLGFDNVALASEDIVAGADTGAALVAQAHDRILIGVAAEMLGVMGRAHQIAVDYLKQRQQFGKPIGSFQALQHRAFDAYIEVEIVRSLLFQVAASLDSSMDSSMDVGAASGRNGRARVAAVKARASSAVLAVTKSAIQLHGAIGFTDEHDIGLYLRRAMVLASLYGTAASERARYARLSGGR